MVQLQDRMGRLFFSMIRRRAFHSGDPRSVAFVAEFVLNASRQGAYDLSDDHVYNQLSKEYGLYVVNFIQSLRKETASWLGPLSWFPLACLVCICIVPLISWRETEPRARHVSSHVAYVANIKNFVMSRLSIYRYLDSYPNLGKWSLLTLRSSLQESILPSAYLLF